MLLPRACPLAAHLMIVFCTTACLLTAPTRTRPPHFLLELFRHDPTRHITLNLTHTHAPTHITTPQLVFCTQHNLRLFDRNYRPFKAFPSQYSSQVHYRPQLQASLHSFTLLTSSLGSLSQQVLLVVSLSLSSSINPVTTATTTQPQQQ